MAESSTGDALTASASRCPWCSMELPEPDAPACPSCHARLVGDNEPNLPGVTAVDLKALALRRSQPVKRSRLLGWISGDGDSDEMPAMRPAPGSLQPPSLEVRREMLRLEIEAELAAHPEAAPVEASAPADSIDADASEGGGEGGASGAEGESQHQPQ